MRYGATHRGFKSRPLRQPPHLPEAHVAVADPAQFSGRPSAAGPGSALVVLCLIVASIVLAIAKPWDRPAPPWQPATTLATLGLTSPSASALASTPARASVAAPSPVPLAAFKLAPPPVAGTAWTAVRWRVLGASDPLAHLGSATHWSGGYASIGDAGLRGSLLWTSPDGIAWSPVGNGAEQTLWPGLGVVAVAPLQRELVALTMLRADAAPSGSSASGAGVVAWASSDGTAWTPIGGATFPVPPETTGPPLLAGSGTRLVLAWNLASSPSSTNASARFAVTDDGVAWHRLPASALPAGFVVTDVTAAPGRGFLAAGQIVTDVDARPAILRSDATGRVWSPVALPEDATIAPAERATVVWSILTGASGALAAGDGPAGELWWQSADGRRWTGVSDAVPIGASACSGSTPGCARSLTGLIAGDGAGIVAVGGGGAGADAGLTAWTSSDGARWQQLDASGAVPTGPPGAVGLMPGGIVLVTASGEWYGEAASDP